MSRFTKFTSVQLTAIGDPYYTLTAKLVYERFYKGSKKYIVVPEGTKTDFASLPWAITIVWKKDDPRWIKASIIHDYLWSKAIKLEEYQTANKIFYEAMQVEGTPKHIAILFYIAVSISKYLYFIFK